MDYLTFSEQFEKRINEFPFHTKSASELEKTINKKVIDLREGDILKNDQLLIGKNLQDLQLKTYEIPESTALVRAVSLGGKMGGIPVKILD